MESIFDDSNDNESIEFGHLDNNQYSDNWMSEIFDTVGDQLLNDQLMTDIVADHSNIKTEALFQDDILDHGFDICVKSEMSSLTVPSPRSPLVASTNSPSPNLSVESSDSGELQQSDVKPDIACLTDPNLNNAHNIHSSVGNTVTISSTDSTSITNGNSRSLLRDTTIPLQNPSNFSQRVHYYVRHNSNNPTVYVQTSGSHNSNSYRHVVPRIKRQDVYDRSEKYDNRPDSTTGYVLYPDTPPGSSNSSDSEISGLGCSGAGDDPSPSYSLNCYSNNGSRNSVSSLNNSINHHNHHQPIFQNPIPQSGVLILTEEEKRTLISEGYSIPNRLPLTKQEERNLKKIRRKIKNKISAQESRRKKKEYLETLEKKVEAYSQENSELKRRLDNLETTNRSLLSQLRHLQQLAGKAGSSAAGTCLMVLMLCFAVFLAGVPGMHEWDGLSRSGNTFTSAPALNQIGYASLSKRGPITYYNRGAKIKQGLDKFVFNPERYDNLSNFGYDVSQSAKMLTNPSRDNAKEEPALSSRSRLLDAPKEYPEECVPSSTWWWFGMSTSIQEHAEIEAEEEPEPIGPVEPAASSLELSARMQHLNNSGEVIWLRGVAYYESSDITEAPLNIQVNNLVSPGA